MDRERIYAVTFNSYTNGLRNAVSDGNKDIAKTEYIHLSEDVPFLIRESELLYYSKFGQGYSVIRCVGELPDKKCDKKIGTDTPITGGTVAVPEISINGISGCDAVCAISSSPKRCGGCDKTDGMCYTSNPPQVKCIITGKFHYYDDVCDCDTITATN